MIKVNASILEDGLIEELEKIIEDNKELFEDSEVALMPDAHKTGGIPVGFTMTVPHYKVAPDFISSDVSCGMTGYIIRDYVPTQKVLSSLSRLARDLIPVNRRFCIIENEITDLGTLGNGNHLCEIGTDGKDTLITVHSGSRDFGGRVYRKWKQKAKDQFKEELDKSLKTMLETVEPKERQEWIKNNKPPKRDIDYIDLSDERLRNEFQHDYLAANLFAFDNRCHMLSSMLVALGIENNFEYINTTHNYIDFQERPWVIRKGAIKATKGEQVIIPINMRDGVVVGTVTDRSEFNNSLPHGAGRILSRTAAFKTLDLETFEDDMKDVVSPTVQIETLDESPRAYKDINTILNDIGDGLEDVRIYKTIFNYKGV